jgi:hypothetical protein
VECPAVQVSLCFVWVRRTVSESPCVQQDLRCGDFESIVIFKVESSNFLMMTQPQRYFTHKSLISVVEVWVPA